MIYTFTPDRQVAIICGVHQYFRHQKSTVIPLNAFQRWEYDNDHYVIVCKQMSDNTYTTYSWNNKREIADEGHYGFKTHREALIDATSRL